MSGYAKLSSSIVLSTVWREPHTTRVVWITLLALADPYGYIAGSVPGLADVARVTIPECEAAIACFTAPDPYSRSTEHGGRRIAVVDGGWQLLNYTAYRDGRDPEARRRQNREAQNRWRERHPHKPDVSRVSQRKPLRKQMSAQADSDPEANTDPRTEREPSALVLAPDLVKVDQAETVRDLWNETTSSPIPKCKELTLQRRRHADARLKERGIDGLREVFTRINASAFCRGENDRGWRANIDWALKPATITKTIEGAYDSTPSRTPPGSGRTGAPANSNKYAGIVQRDPVSENKS